MSSANSYSPLRIFSPSKYDKQEILDTASSAASPPRYDPRRSTIDTTIYKDPLRPPSPQPALSKDEISPKPEASKYVWPKIFNNVPSLEEAARRVPYAGYTITEPIIFPYSPVCLHPPPPEDKELSELEKQGILERSFRMHLLAMKHYNDTRKEGEDEYKVSTSSVPRRMVQSYTCLGFLHKLIWEGQPISTEKSDSTKCFIGAVHEMNPDEMHVAYAKPLRPDLSMDLNLARLPTCCERCDIKDHDEFRQRDQELEDQVKKNKAFMSFGPRSLFRDAPEIMPSTDTNRYEGDGMEEEMHKKKNCDDHETS